MKLTNYSNVYQVAPLQRMPSFKGRSDAEDFSEDLRQFFSTPFEPIAVDTDLGTMRLDYRNGSVFFYITRGGSVMTLTPEGTFQNRMQMWHSLIC